MGSNDEKTSIIVVEARKKLSDFLLGSDRQFSKKDISVIDPIIQDAIEKVLKDFIRKNNLGVDGLELRAAHASEPRIRIGDGKCITVRAGRSAQASDLNPRCCHGKTSIECDGTCSDDTGCKPPSEHTSNPTVKETGYSIGDKLVEPTPDET